MRRSFAPGDDRLRCKGELGSDVGFEFLLMLHSHKDGPS